MAFLIEVCTLETIADFILLIAVGRLSLVQRFVFPVLLIKWL